jgi:2'-5' RNA ligase
VEISTAYPQTRNEKIGKYFIAIIPPEPGYEQIENLKNYFSDHYHTKAALKSPPHITLHMPFEWKLEKEEILCNGLKSFFGGLNAFELELQNFSCFAPRTIFINVIKTEALEQLEVKLHRFCRMEFNLFNARYQDLPFHPHVTIAFRDLRKTTFAKAWNEFLDKKFTDKFRVVNVVLLKHNGKLWEPLRYFLLN